MAEWRHVFEGLPGSGVVGCAVIPRRDLDSCGCTTPTPDPASPCGYRYPDDDGTPCWTHRPEYDHPHVPTRCTCGHPITKEET